MKHYSLNLTVAKYCDFETSKYVN